MRKITFGAIAFLLLFAACSNPIDASHDNEPPPPDSSLRTNSGEGASSISDSLNKAGQTTGQPGVNTVTGQPMGPSGSSGSQGMKSQTDSSGSKGTMKNTGDNKSTGKSRK